MDETKLELKVGALLVAAMNPTARGDLRVGGGSAMDRYLERLSGPVIDRIDLHVEVAAVPFDALLAARPAEGTDALRARVLAARERSVRRQGEVSNAALAGAALDAADLLAVHVLHFHNAEHLAKGFFGVGKQLKR